MLFTFLLSLDFAVTTATTGTAATTAAAAVPALSFRQLEEMINKVTKLIVFLFINVHDQAPLLFFVAIELHGSV